MPIKIEPFVNPLRQNVEKDGKVIITYKGQKYEKVVRK